MGVNEAIPLVDQALCSELVSDSPLRMVSSLQEKNIIKRISQIHLTSPALYSLLTSSRIGELAAKVTGLKQIEVWRSQLYFKPLGSRDEGKVVFIEI